MMTMNAGTPLNEYSTIPLAQTVVAYCQLKNIQHIVISPGSRNAPLTKGFVSNPYFKTYSIVDERSAAFFALGIAQQTRTAVALLCTSGSALLNYYPAVAEAFYSDVPLVILSADRMPHRIDIGDGQTIQQKGVFEPHLVDAAYLTPDVSHATAVLLEHTKQQLLSPDASPLQVEQRQAEIQLENETAINRVLNAVMLENGPVHLNIPLEEPLYETTNKAISIAVTESQQHAPSSIDFQAVFDHWNRCEKKMILVGVLPPNSLTQSVIDHLAADPSIIVLTETTSNLSHFNFIQSIDSFIAPLEDSEVKLSDLQPDFLLTFGGMIVSKKVKAFLRKHPPQQHFHVDPKKAYDTFYCLTAHLKTAVQHFFDALVAQHKSYVRSTYCSDWLTQYNRQRLRGKSYLDSIPFSDLKAFERIFNYLPHGILLQLSNSSTIRYAQLFSLPPLAGIFCNRGTSGIDGSTSTAMGSAWVSDKPMVFITGDLSFFYDINAFWNNYLKKTSRIILINNQGGGIFRILPGEKDTPTYDTYFETVQNRSVKKLCKAYGIGYRSAQTAWGLSIALKRFFGPSKNPQLLEIKTPRKLNDIVLLNYFKQMRDEEQEM